MLYYFWKNLQLHVGCEKWTRIVITRIACFIPKGMKRFIQKSHETERWNLKWAKYTTNSTVNHNVLMFLMQLIEQKKPTFQKI